MMSPGYVNPSLMYSGTRLDCPGQIAEMRSAILMKLADTSSVLVSLEFMKFTLF